MSTSDRFFKFLAAACFLFAGITMLWLQTDPVFRWLGGSLFVLMSLQGVLRMRLEARNTEIPAKGPLAWFVDALTFFVIPAGWLALTLLHQFYGPAALFFAFLVWAAWSRLRGPASTGTGGTGAV